VPGDPDHYQKLTASINKSIDAVGDVGDKVIDALRKYEVVPVEKLDKIEKAIIEASEGVNVLQDASTVAAKAYDEKIQNNDPIGGWLKVGEIVAGLFCPEAALLLAAVGGGYGVIKKKETKVIKSDNAVLGKKYTAHKIAGERIMRSPEPLSSDRIYNIIGEERNNVGL
jgi:hypothetical protein